jgi:hypothetical protein
MRTGRRCLLAGLVLAWLIPMLLAGETPATATPTIVVAGPPSVAQYEVAEFTFQVPTAYEPSAGQPDARYDQDKFDVRALITTPDGRTEQAVAFWYEPVSIVAVSGGTDYQADEAAGKWKVRYAPLKQGAYQYRIEAIDRTGASPVMHTSAAGSFATTAPISRGFVRTDPRNPTRFMFDSGDAFLPVGVNMGWSDDPEAYAGHFAAFNEHGMNFARVWMLFAHPSPHFQLEWGRGPYSLDVGQVDKVEFGGIGSYAQENAAKLDTLLARARANDVYLMLTLWTHHAFWVPDWYPNNPYQAIGPVGADARNFWSDATARRYFRNYVRYVGARWGAYRHLALVEFWNELDYSAADHPYARRPSPFKVTGGTTLMRDWHLLMAETLLASAPRLPLTTTSFSHRGRKDPLLPRPLGRHLVLGRPGPLGGPLQPAVLRRRVRPRRRRAGPADPRGRPTEAAPTQPSFALGSDHARRCGRQQPPLADQRQRHERIRRPEPLRAATRGAS